MPTFTQIAGSLPAAAPAAGRPAGAPVSGGARLDHRDPEGIARQFEQLLVRQLLSQLRNSGLNADADAQRPSAGYLQLADDHLAATVAAVGGLGLATSARRWLEGVPADRPVPVAVPKAAG